MLKTVSAAVVATSFLVGAAAAQTADRTPPADSKKLSEIVAKVEQREGFRYIGDIEWDDGAYEVTYYTTDKAKVEIRFDPVTGEPK
jgi:hypothetical protein